MPSHHHKIAPRTAGMHRWAGLGLMLYTRHGACLEVRLLLAPQSEVWLGVLGSSLLASRSADAGPLAPAYHFGTIHPRAPGGWAGPTSLG